MSEGNSLEKKKTTFPRDGWMVSIQWIMDVYCSSGGGTGWWQVVTGHGQENTTQRKF